ncbi:hypothetical protein SUGI_0784300 [Cryptomeria japonica]|uniref:uncharacterized protein LOC131038964 n=1 Tax=Cryptomeria japonica TaxID=3369 RepID=UPI0024148E8E|nr:uncharacterized protein LOC131038964 [Cryptomeria japonica]GLJ38489.1 hypothetical protein SUGI_0784300 [Cryptomeria japonica]
MGSQTTKNMAKQGALGSKGGLHRGLNEPNISGAYIRSLVKQLTSCRSHASPRGLKTEVPKSSSCRTLKESSGNEEHMIITAQDSNDTHKPDDGSCMNPVCLPQQQKKQVRRRPHTRKTAQDYPLDIAEARRQIVTALHLHRAAASKLHAARNQTPSQKPNNYSSISSNQNSSSYNQSAGMRIPATGCNSCMAKGTTTLQKEAQAITICGHLLCWMCLSEHLLYLSSSVYKGCPVCAKPLTANHIFPIALGVPIPTEQSANYATPVLLQSAPLLTNPLPLPQPSWSTTGPSLGITKDGISSAIDISQGRNVGYVSESPTVLEQSFTAFDDATTAKFTMAPENPKSDIASVKPEHESSMKSNWHVEMDEEELAEIRSLGEQHEMEWSDSVNLATSTWWFKFLKTSECNQDLSILYQTEIDQSDNCSLENALIQDEMEFYPELLLQGPLNNMNESLYFSSDLPVESLWADERFDCYDWIQGLKNPDDYNEIEVYDNHSVPSSEVLKINKSPFDEALPDDTSDLHSDSSSNNPVNKAGV